MKKIIRLTESDLSRIVRKVLKESELNEDTNSCFEKNGLPVPTGCKEMVKTNLKSGTSECLKELAITYISDPIGYKKVNVISCIMGLEK
jgi:hypothetical protein